MKIVLLGTGGPRPDPKRNASTTLIRLGGENILFDAGRGVVNQLVRAGVPLDSVNPVFITHHHFDHIGDLYDVALATWMYGRKKQTAHLRTTGNAADHRCPADPGLRQRPAMAVAGRAITRRMEAGRRRGCCAGSRYRDNSLEGHRRYC